MIEGGFRPKSLGLFRSKIHVITFTFFYVFYVFFENPKNVTFLRFFALLHTYVFSNYVTNIYHTVNDTVAHSNI